MRRARILLTLGIWVAILPYLGFPGSWKDVFFIVTGLILIYISYALYKEFKIKSGKSDSFDNFSENKHFGTGEQ